MRSFVMVLLFTSAVYAAKVIDTRVLLQDGVVYEILSNTEKGALTIDVHSTESVQVFTRTYNETSGQKWRLKKAKRGKSFRLIPTSNDRVNLDLDKKTLGIWGRIAAVGNQKFWNLKNMGEGLIQIQNWQKNNLCLTAVGLDKEISVAECENSPNQQWKFIPL